ncbi:uncharacterized protein LOC142558436 [Dermacentor variabilis]|uniref:uncharacterized protein LOC142558436 n=1 Tax=Dermacentor variabilis TaxID=34621 RepID=UPI003F5C4A85
MKHIILDRNTASESARLRHPLTTEEHGDRRPSQLLDSMRRLLGSSNVDENGALSKELFLQRLRQATGLVLAAARHLTLDHLAQLADRDDDGDFPYVIAFSSAPESSIMARLEAQINQLAVFNDDLRASSQDQRGSSSRLSGPPWLQAAHRARQCKSLCQWFGNAQTAACDLDLQPGRLFIVTDRISSLRFVADTGAEVSLLPPSKHDRASKSLGPTLRAANSTSIATYGLRSFTAVT